MAKRFKMFSQASVEYIEGTHDLWFTVLDEYKRPIDIVFNEHELRKLRRMITQCLRH